MDGSDTPDPGAVAAPRRDRENGERDGSGAHRRSARGNSSNSLEASGIAQPPKGWADPQSDPVADLLAYGTYGRKETAT